MNCLTCPFCGRDDTEEYSQQFVQRAIALEQSLTDTIELDPVSNEVFEDMDNEEKKECKSYGESIKKNRQENRNLARKYIQLQRMKRRKGKGKGKGQGPAPELPPHLGPDDLPPGAGPRLDDSPPAADPSVFRAIRARGGDGVGRGHGERVHPYLDGNVQHCMFCQTDLGVWKRDDVHERYIVICRMDDGNLAKVAPWKTSRKFTTVGEDNHWWCIEHLHNMRRCCTV